MRTSHSVAVALGAGIQLAAAAPVCGGGSTSDTLWVTTYPIGEGSGELITLKLEGSTLENVAQSETCGPYPSWLTQADDVLYCVNEAWGGDHGDLAALQINDDLSFTKLSGGETIGGPVSTVVYGNGGRGLAVADYGAGGIDTFNIEDPKAITLIKSLKYPIPEDATENPQDIARPHEAILDPTGDFLVFPDLGADLLRVLKVDKETLEYTETESHVLTRGTGPRHGAFFTSGDSTFFYVVCELANLLQGFSVTYAEDGLTFTQIYSANTHGEADALPEAVAAAEIFLAPNSNFLTLSSRYENALEYTVANGTVVPSDPLITFSIDATSGELTHVQTAPAGGANPRHFSFNSDGSRVASALQADGRVVIFERDTATGKIGNVVAEVDVAGMPNFVSFKQ
ncbi:Lactonase, 7-bladed beta-propeller-domain-containing protein [Chaetomium fimeti]|jgi:6-phosphogluconolactonase (cycloisomerase 2 family)|uniref:Lactonase, 7-bladed beta-propeller-domain-containing protein n=1 Tax=Chaetomium fimeti TaxID=1854472 RepID=A0AAE0LR40_9PEZI|nr:Lactonase, 7-bladed beta-propeller-domain-containing protein [Chaetomium fimeti]